MNSGHIVRCLALAGALVAGCGTVRREVIVSRQHPANPDAAEAPPVAESTTLVVAPTPTPGGAVGGSGAPRRVQHGSPSGGER